MLNYLLAPQIQSMLFPLKVMSILASIFFLGVIFYTFFKTRWFRFLFWYEFVEFFTLEIYGASRTRKTWRRVWAKTQHMDPITSGRIVIQLHDELGKLLLRLVPNFQSNSFGDRLARLGPSTFSNIDDIWEAHEIYRSVVRENHEVTPDEIKKVLAIYYQAFKDLGIIKK
jgi:hypothetical protein